MRNEFSRHRQDFKFSCVFRAAAKSDLSKLEWFGAFTEHRRIIEEAFAAQARGQGLMLVATVDDFPIAQLWVRLPSAQPPRFWAFRVLQPFQRLGLGSQLFRLAESMLAVRHIATCEIGVEKSNPAALRLYQKMGYRTSYEQVEEYSYVTPDGETRLGRADQWILQKSLKRPQAAGRLKLPEAAAKGRPGCTAPFDGSTNGPA